MAYKTILVHVDDAPHAAARILMAAELALQDGAHLIGAAMTGVSRFLYQNEMVDEQDPNLALHLDFLRQRARRALVQFGPHVQALGLRSFEERLLDDEPGAGLSLLARHADLVVLSQADPERQGAPLPDYQAQVLTDAGRPVLLVPHAARTASAIAVNAAGVASAGAPAPGQHVLVAWNASKEAARALHEALPLLARAASVHLAIFDAELRPGVYGDKPGEDVQRWLERHGIHAGIVLRQSARQGLLKRPADIGDALLALASELGSDLLVLGAYGHSRFRETLLGGVTRTVLESMHLPVLMAH
ncbi:universal stress protein [Pseudoduganella violacea]|uniref:Nucleotide-binding universal stress UspA family protein n=1 Tax=Pseudoduganella violacea TaxID=1715466 RepID=A0A7W5FTG8_9BURK|nr:universal stress protein [Pseudoduganella violacea]MBB3118566.1 nucleotide-binding universal stress UspA family protein [Pseudoduganella violacea]